MDNEITKRLFSKDELWYNEKIHANLIPYIFGSLLKSHSMGFVDQDEYYFQNAIHEYLTHKLLNTEFSSSREINGFGRKRIDHSVLHIPSSKSVVFYEVKTFIKESEQQIIPSKIYQDIIKIALKKHLDSDCEAYLMFAGKSEYIKSLIYTSAKIMLPHKYDDPLNKSSMDLSINTFISANVDKSFLTELERLNIKKISISPSRWIDNEGFAVMTWRINKVTSSNATKKSNQSKLKEKNVNSQTKSKRKR